MTEGSNRALIDTLISSVMSELNGPELIKQFERSSNGLWASVQSILGEITLRALFRRALILAGRRFPEMELIKIGPAGVSCGGLKVPSDAASTELLRQGMRDFLLEFFSMIEKLAASILAPILRAEVAKQIKEGIKL